MACTDLITELGDILITESGIELVTEDSTCPGTVVATNIIQGFVLRPMEVYAQMMNWN